MWNANGKLGTKQEQHRFNVASKLKDMPNRPDAGLMSDAQAEDGAERMALAIALTRNRAIKAPDPLLAQSANEPILDASEILRNWSPEQRSALLRRALFDPATYGRVRFHHRSVQEFLAASRLFKLKQAGMSVRATFRLLFAEKYGEKVVIPSMRPIAAWISLWDDDVFRELVSRAPEALIEHGDPASLSIPNREAIINGFVTRHRSGGWRGFRFPMEQINRIASPELAGAIKRCWKTEPENAEVRELLVELIWKGPMPTCTNIVNSVATKVVNAAHHRADAIKALAACSATVQLKRIAKQMLAKPASWPPKLISSVLADLFPSHLNIDELVTLLQRHQARSRGESSDGFEWALTQIVSNNAFHFDRSGLRRKLTRLVKEGTQPGGSWHEVQNRYHDLCSVIATLCLLELETYAEHVPSDLLASCAVAYHLCGRELTEDPIKALHAWFFDKPVLRAEVFWMETAIMDEVATAEDSWNRFWNVQHHSLIGNINVSDKAWVEQALHDASGPKRQEVALQAWINIWAMEGLRRSQLTAMQASLQGNGKLTDILEERTKKSRDSAAIRRHEKEAKQWQAKRDAKEKQRLADWKQWRIDLTNSPDEHFADKRLRGTIHNLFKWLNMCESSSSSNGVWHFRSLVNAFGQSVADRAREAFMNQWRETRPELWSERLESERNSTPYVWLHGLCGVMAEAEMPGWTKTLTSDEAKLATRYATVEMNRLASFITELATTRPEEVDAVLGSELKAELERGASHSYLPVLQDLTHADVALKNLLKPRLIAFLTKQRSFKAQGDKNHWDHNLNEAFGILSETATESEAGKIGGVCMSQLKKSARGSLPLIWLRGVFRFVPQQAPDLFMEWFQKIRGSKYKLLALQAIASLFGDWGGIGVRITDHDQRARALGKLIRLAYRIVRPEDDIVHEGAYSPDTRDDAERGRSLLLSALLETPGQAAQQLIIQLSREREFRHFPDRLRQLASERAAKDAEFEAWSAASVASMDYRHELPPKGRDELFQVMIDRLEDLQHDLYNDDFSDRRTLQTITLEVEMQRSIAQKLQAMARDAYALDREPEVAEAKKPDIRLRSNSDATKAAIEIKIADNKWSLKDLETALKAQLVGQYLRHVSCRAGCLLLTFNGKRKRWPRSRGKALNAVELVLYLNQLAQKIEAQSGGQLRVTVFGLHLTDKLSV